MRSCDPWCAAVVVTGLALALALRPASADPETVDGLLAPPPPQPGAKRSAAAAAAPVTSVRDAAAEVPSRVNGVRNGGPRAKVVVHRVHRFHPDSLARPLTRQGKAYLIMEDLL